jgi:hypothetical protein
MGKKPGWISILALSILVVLPVAAAAGPIPSKTESASPDAASDLARVQTVLARQEVAQALVAHGLRPDEVDQRLAQLSPEDLRSLAAHVDQVQAAGNVPNYIWILLGIFLAVSIIIAVF